MNSPNTADSDRATICRRIWEGACAKGDCARCGERGVPCGFYGRKSLRPLNVETFLSGRGSINYFKMVLGAPTLVRLCERCAAPEARKAARELTGLVELDTTNPAVLEADAAVRRCERSAHAAKTDGQRKAWFRRAAFYRRQRDQLLSSERDRKFDLEEEPEVEVPAPFYGDLSDI